VAEVVVVRDVGDDQAAELEGIDGALPVVDGLAVGLEEGGVGDGGVPPTSTPSSSAASPCTALTPDRRSLRFARRVHKIQPSGILRMPYALWTIYVTMQHRHRCISIVLQSYTIILTLQRYKLYHRAYESGSSTRTA
jgi:hypothetical protein